MGAKRFEELIVWQLADALRQHVIEITDSGPSASDFRFRSQIREAADSVCDNTAEGFGRYGHGDFARFVTIARGSLDEVRGKLRAGLKRRYFTQEQHDTGERKANRTHGAMMGLIRYLRRSRAPEPFASDSGDESAPDAPAPDAPDAPRT
jgi:four helix bundle protein